MAPSDSAARPVTPDRGTYLAALLDSPAEEAFDRLTRLAARLLGAPVALVSLVDQDRQFVKSASGLPEPWASRRSLPLSYGFCPQIVQSKERLMVGDARHDPMTRQNAAIRELGWVAHLSVPIIQRDGSAVGVMSVVDTMPRLWSERDAELLGDLAASVASEIELRRVLADRSPAVAAAGDGSAKDTLLLSSSDTRVIRDWDLGTDRLRWVAEPSRLFGYEPAALGTTAAGWYERLHADDRERVVAGIAEALARGDRAWTDDYRFRAASGSYTHVRDRAVVTYNEAGAPVRFVAAMVEAGSAAPERPDAVDHLRQMQKLEAIGQLAGGIAHDFNNLLTGILGYCDLILHQLRDGDPIRDDIDQIRHAGQRAAVLTRQLLAFSRRQTLQPRVVSLNHIVDDLDGMLRRVLGTGVTFETTLDPKLWHVFADPSQLEQVLVNLIVNARDAVRPLGGKPDDPPAGCVSINTANVQRGEAESVTTLPPGEYVLLAVSDTGIGIDQATQTRIFEPFFTTKEFGRGSGLGLSTVYGIVQQSGGDVTVESAPGCGATFRVYLPRYLGSAAALPLTGGTRRDASETLLLVEDEPAVRSSARRLLERYGYTVLEARHGAEAIRVFEMNEAQIALVITDVMMPEMGGRELVERLRVARPALKVLFMSGYTEMAIPVDGIMPPHTAFIEKPFTVEGLTRQVRDLLDERALAR